MLIIYKLFFTNYSTSLIITIERVSVKFSDHFKTKSINSKTLCLKSIKIAIYFWSGHKIVSQSTLNSMAMVCLLA